MKYTKLSKYLLVMTCILSCEKEDNDISTIEEFRYDNEIISPKINIYQEKNKIIR